MSNVTNNKSELWKTVRRTSFQKPQWQSVLIFSSGSISVSGKLSTWLITTSRSHINAYQRCNHPTTKWVFFRIRTTWYVFTSHFTLARHQVYSSSMVRASEWIMEGCGFESHLSLGFFSELPFDAKAYHVVVLLQKDSLLIFEQLFSCFTWFGGSFHRLNYDKFRDTSN